MDLSLAAFALAASATVIGATIQGGVGFGMNLVTVPVLALVAPESLPAAVIVLGIPVSASMLRYDLRALDTAGLGWLIGGRLPGSLFGAWIVATVSTNTLQAVVGLILLLIVAASAVSPPVPVRPATQLATGVVSGITGTSAGIGGPPVALLYQRSTGPTIRATLAASFLVGTFMSLIVLGISGSVTRSQLLLGITLAPFVLMGVIVGRRFHAALERGWMRRAVLGFAAISALVVLIDALV